MRKFTDQDKITELEREIWMRRKVYPDQVRKGAMSGKEAWRRVELLEEILAEYRDRVQPRLAI